MGTIKSDTKIKLREYEVPEVVANQRHVMVLGKTPAKRLKERKGLSEDIPELSRLVLKGRIPGITKLERQKMIRAEIYAQFGMKGSLPN